MLDSVAKLASAGAQPLKALEVAIPDSGAVAEIVERWAAFNITSSGLIHWYADMKRQTLASWVALAGRHTTRH
ncbi:hypothetical protein ACFY4C_22550 [Actinomadura viridis]|uniref:hypothetical protein n=1 Tax=Actinomadura viridis TaxID=58110 RepID=UPI0036A729F1